jgi:O-antigen/teichoic acid export membrane protein
VDTAALRHGDLWRKIVPFAASVWVTNWLANLLKLWGLALLVASVVLLLAAPTLFDVAFRGKYSGGLEVLSLTVLYLGWEGLSAVATSYLWCAERPSLGSLPLAAGLALNIGLNLLLVPTYGLHGAVTATTLANLLSLTLAYALNAYLGAKPGRAVWLVSLAPASLLLGAWATAAVTLVLLHQAWHRDWLFDAAEKARLTALVRGRKSLAS